MRYSLEFKLECIELHRRGVWKETPDGVKTSTFRRRIREWDTLEDMGGIEALRPKTTKPKFTTDEKLEVVQKALNGSSISQLATVKNINYVTIYNWIKLYNEHGYNGLIPKKKGRPRKNKPMRIDDLAVNPAPLNESEREELVRLRAEVEHYKMELAVTKKVLALRKEKREALLRAKKRGYLDLSENKVIN